MLDFGFYNMDCIEGMKEFPDDYFDLAICDPPYGGVTQGGYMANPHSCDKKAKTKGYHLSLWSMGKPDKDYFDELKRVSKNQIIWGGNYFTSFLSESQCWVVWDKENGDNDFADCELAWTSFNLASRLFRFRWAGMLQGNMKNKETRIHPTQKPVALYEWLIGKFANDGDIILDTHVGSASNLIACHKTNHKFVGFEIDEEYYQQAKARLDTEMAQKTIFDYTDQIQGQISIDDLIGGNNVSSNSK